MNWAWAWLVAWRELRDHEVTGLANHFRPNDALIAAPALPGDLGAQAAINSPRNSWYSPDCGSGLVPFPARWCVGVFPDHGFPGDCP